MLFEIWLTRTDAKRKRAHSLYQPVMDKVMPLVEDVFAHNFSPEPSMSAAVPPCVSIVVASP